MVLVVNTPPAGAGDVRDEGSVPGLRRSPGEGHGNSLQYSSLENPRDRGAVTKGWTRLKQLGTHALNSEVQLLKLLALATSLWLGWLTWQDP